MKLILSSAGFTTPEIIAKCVELVGRPQRDINFAVINEAYAVEHGDHGWVVENLNKIRNNFHGRVELVNLLALDAQTVRQRIALADVIYVVGGHTDYLMSVLRKTGFDKTLIEALKTKVYVGSSAGSMILGKRVSTAAYAKIYGEENNYGTTEYLGLCNFALKPHFNSEAFPNNNAQVLAEVTKNHDGTVYALADDAAIVVDGENAYTIGTSPLKIVDGTVV